MTSAHRHADSRHLLDQAQQDPRQVATVDLAAGAEGETSYWLEQLAACLATENRTRTELFLVRLPRRPTEETARRLAQLATKAASRSRSEFIVLGDFAAHWGDRQSLEAERQAEPLLVNAGRRALLLRLGNVIADAPRQNANPPLRVALHPLLPTTLRSCFVPLAEVQAAIEFWRKGPRPSRTGGRVGTVTLLGRNALLRDHWRTHSFGVFGPHRWIEGFARGAELLGGRHLAAMAFTGAAPLRPALRRWRCQTLEPSSQRDLVSLVASPNRHHVAVAGYNTGATHFGWKFPGRTIVKTVGCSHRLRIRGEMLEADAGVTIKEASVALARSDKQLLVRPNYSYVALGTAFFVPIHGSGVSASVLGDTIEEVLAYDPKIDRVVKLRRSDAQFRASIYHPASGLVVLRLRFRVGPRQRYFVCQSRLESPSAEQVWETFQDQEPSNIELRKSQATAAGVDVCKYYLADEADRDGIETAADSIGKLWDRIEETPVASALFHALVRRFGYHVELFLDREQFAIFWQAHQRLPLAKIQLRFARCDRFPHSPCGDTDRVTIDLFMKRSRCQTFQAFLREYIPHARFNRGKHSL
jgi:hypothetical protein